MMANNRGYNRRYTRKPKKLKVQHHGVPEGRYHSYDKEDKRFTFCGNSIDLYEDEDGGVVEFEHFVHPAQFHGRYPKTAGIFNHSLIDNLDDMGITSMRPSQIAAMMAIFFEPPDETCPGRSDLVCISTTGSGKTVAYLVVAIQKCLNRIRVCPSGIKRTPTVLIFAHSNSLVLNIYNTALKLTEGTDVIVELIAGSTKFIKNTFFDIGICTIGRFQNHLYGSNTLNVKIDFTRLQLLVLDEADEMMKNTDLKEIFNKLALKAEFSVLLFSATVNNTVLSIVNRKNLYEFYGGHINKVSDSVKTMFWEVCTRSTSRISGVTEENLTIGHYDEHELRHPFDALVHFLRAKHFNEPDSKEKVIIFVKRPFVADYTALRLSHYGFPAVSVHKKHDLEFRTKYINDFMSGKCRILLATYLLTRGTDIDVDYVINYDLPTEYVQWIHRCGRTGRNGNRGVAITFVDLQNPEDYNLNVFREIALNHKGSVPEFMKAFVKKTKEQDEATKQKVQNMAVEYGM